MLTLRGRLVAAAFFLGCVVAGFLTLSPQLVAQSTAYPVRVGPNGRYLVDQNNQPYYMHGESAWSLIANVTREDAAEYLENRRQKGYNTLMVMLLNHEYARNAPANIYGVQPFTTPGDFNTPNEPYFQHADYVINTAAAKGQQIILAPVYLGWRCNNQGFCAEIRNSSLATMRNWGRWVGNRYRNFPNIVWLIGGDTDAFAHGVADKMNEFVAGLREMDTSHLITVHNERGQSAYSLWGSASWLTLNNSYTDIITYTQTANEYNRNNGLPVFNIEAWYENQHGITPLGLRSQAYWSVLSGGLGGHIFGNCPITTFGTAPEAPECNNTNWKPHMESQGSVTVGYLHGFLKSRSWHLLVPDTSNQVMTAGHQSATTRAYAARASDGSSVIAYLPTQRGVTINMTSIAGGSANVWWYNPRTNSSTSGGTFGTTGSQSFTSPDGNDWVLVVDNATLNLPAPGTPPPPAPSAPSNLRIISGL